MTERDISPEHSQGKKKKGKKPEIVFDLELARATLGTNGLIFGFSRDTEMWKLAVFMGEKGGKKFSSEEVDKFLESIGSDSGADQAIFNLRHFIEADEKNPKLIVNISGVEDGQVAVYRLNANVVFLNRPKDNL